MEAVDMSPCLHLDYVSMQFSLDICIFRRTKLKFNFSFIQLFRML